MNRDIQTDIPFYALFYLRRFMFVKEKPYRIVLNAISLLTVILIWCAYHTDKRLENMFDPYSKIVPISTRDYLCRLIIIIILD